MNQLNVGAHESLDNADIPAELILETVRIFFVRPSSQSGYEWDLLTAVNGVRPDDETLDTNKSELSEAPGGKVYDTRAGQKEFAKLTEEEKAALRARTAVEEAEQEVGVYVNPNRLNLIGSTVKTMTGQYEKVPGVQFKRTTFYVVAMHESEYQTLPDEWAAHTASDDQHVKVEWLSLKADDLDPEVLSILLADNTLPDQAMLEAIDRAIVDQKEATMKRLRRVIGEDNILVNAGTLLSVPLGKEVAGEQKLSFADVTLPVKNRVDAMMEPPAELTPESIDAGMKLNHVEFQQAYERTFKTTLDASELNRAKSLLLVHCLPHVAERARFMRVPASKIKQLNRLITQAVNGITSVLDLYNFFKAYNRPAGEQDHSRRLFRAFLGYRKTSDLAYFDYITPHTKDFRQDLIEITQSPEKPRRKRKTTEDEDGVTDETAEKEEIDHKAPESLTEGRQLRRIKDFNGAPCYVELAPNTKELSRMASKSTTKAHIDPMTMKDVYRSRFIVATEDDIPNLITYLTTRLAGAQRGKETAWTLKQEDPNDDDTNLNRDANRREVKVIGSFPVPGTEGSIRIPVEFMIMTQEQYDYNESGARHHEVYMAIQALVEESRPTTPIPEATLEAIVFDLAQDEEVYESYPDAKTGRNTDELKARAQREIKQRFQNFFFKTPEGYYAYQHVSRVRNASDLVVREDEVFRLMAEALNQRCDVKLHAQDYKLIFDAPQTLSDKALIERLGLRLPDFIEHLEQLHWGFQVERDTLLQSLHQALASALGPNKILAEADWALILFANISDIPKPFRQSIRHHASVIRPILARLNGIAPEKIAALFSG